MTDQYAVLGSPISHSKSPIIHNAAFAFGKIPATYQAIELADDLAGFMQNLTPDFRGFSITMPLKTQALDFAERADSLAIGTGSANTLVRTATGWDAFNTDVFGIQQAVAGLKIKTVSVLGTGATARSAIVAMQELGKEVIIWGRTQGSIKQLCAEFEIHQQPKLHKAFEADLVISTLPPRALDEHLVEVKNKPTGKLLDVAYDPWPSKAAELWGESQTISGLEMLIWQAVGQQRLFAGNDLDEPLPAEKELVQNIRAALNMAK
jgi:shikimate dehydrogenase